MNYRIIQCGVMAAALGAANLWAQTDRRLKPVFPSNPSIQTNAPGVGAPGRDTGSAGGTFTNGIRTNGLNQGAAPRENALDSGERKGKPVGFPSPEPAPGNAPSVGKAPSVGNAPSPGTAPRIR